MNVIKPAIYLDGPAGTHIPQSVVDRISDERAPTVSFRVDGIQSVDFASYLGNRGIFLWHGNYMLLR